MEPTPGAGVAVRRATPADVPALGRLGALLVRTHHDLDARRFMAPADGTAAGYGSFLASQLARPKTVVLVAERAGEVIGYAYAGLEGTDWMSLRGPAGVVHDLVVDPEHRRGGVGRILLDAAIRALEELGAPQLVLSTAEGNGPAQRLFERAGFRRTLIEMTRDPGDAR